MPPVDSEAEVNSFVIRFVQDGQSDAVIGWHGLIRHVQTSEERPFAQWPEAVAFIERYVKLQAEPPASAT
jgi:hypothetical protein